VPGDMSALLIGSTPDGAATTDHRLTVLTLPSTELGRMGVETLVDQLEERGGPMRQAVVICRFEEGQSTGPARRAAPPSAAGSTGQPGGTPAGAPPRRRAPYPACRRSALLKRAAASFSCGSPTWP
jgi:hypothetical protein